MTQAEQAAKTRILIAEMVRQDASRAAQANPAHTEGIAAKAAKQIADLDVLGDDFILNTYRSAVTL
jgi:hypothetical protein